MKLAYIFGKGRQERLDLVRAGQAPSEFFLGAIELMAGGHEVGLFEVGEESQYWSDRGVELLRRFGLLPVRTSGPMLRGMERLIGDLRSYDVAVATTTGLAFAAGLLSLRRRWPTALVAIHCGVLHYPHHVWRRRLTRRLLQRMVTAVYGEAEVAPMRALFGPGLAIEAVQFGVDCHFWTPAECNPDATYFLSIGNDGRRDYDTLLRAATGIPCEVRVVTNHRMPDSLPANVKWIRGDWHEAVLSDIQIRDLYRGAAGVITPLKDSEQPSGQSVTLQAMACGKPVVLTDTRGLWSREMMRHDENVVFVPPGSPELIADRARRLLAESEWATRIGTAARRTVESVATIERFAFGILGLCEKAAGAKRDSGPKQVP